MLKKTVLLLCLITFVPVAAGAQTVAPTPASSTQASSDVDLSSPPTPPATALVAQNLAGDAPAAEQQGQQPKKFHSGLTFKEWCEVHFGENRWIYWAGAAAGLVLFHVLVAH